MAKICFNLFKISTVFLACIIFGLIFKTSLVVALEIPLYCPEGWSRRGDYCYIVRPTSVTWSGNLLVSCENTPRGFECKTYPMPEKGTLYGDTFVPDSSPHADTMKDAAYNGKAFQPTGYWPSLKPIPYEIADGFAPRQRQHIMRALQELAEKNCGIKFRPRTGGDNAYIMFVHTKSPICSSNLGRSGKEQYINLGDGCFSSDANELSGTVIHEIMHALGIPHEQQRHDRDQYVEINWNNIEKEHRHNFDPYTQVLPAWKKVSYDFKSLMHYGAMDFARENSDVPPIRPKVSISGGPADEANLGMGQRRKLTRSDVSKLRNLFQCGEGEKPDEKKPPTPTVPRIKQNEKCHVEFERDIISGVAMQPVHNKKAEECCDLCHANNACRGFAWNDYQGGTCYMKSAGGPLIQWPSTIAGYVKGREHLAAREDAAFENQHCEVMNDIDIHGGQEAHPAISGRNFESCCQLCHENERCKAYSWNDYKGGTCYLKTASDNRVNRPGVKSGIVRSRQNQRSSFSPANPAPGRSTGSQHQCSTLTDTDIHGGRSVGNVEHKRFEDCCGVCIANPQCKAFAWNSAAGGTCYLKSASDRQHSASGVKAGVVLSRV